MACAYSAQAFSPRDHCGRFQECGLQGENTGGGLYGENGFLWRKAFEHQPLCDETGLLLGCIFNSETHQGNLTSEYTLAPTDASPIQLQGETKEESLKQRFGIRMSSCCQRLLHRTQESPLIGRGKGTFDTWTRWLAQLPPW